VTDGTWAVLNPLAENVTAYVPGCRKENLYDPFASVVVVRVCPVAVLVRVMLAPDITAPDGSVTVPVKAPVSAVCADDGAAQASNKTKQAKIEHTD